MNVAPNHYTAFYSTVPHCKAPHCKALHCNELHCTALRYIARNALNLNALHCTTVAELESGKWIDIWLEDVLEDVAMKTIWRDKGHMLQCYTI